MPGHANNTNINPYLNDLAQKNGLYVIDGTTDEYFGNLGNYFPASGKIKKSQDEASHLYGTKATFYMVQGTTGSMLGVMKFVGGPKCHALI